jgi:hypothetical protein
MRSGSLLAVLLSACSAAPSLSDAAVADDDAGVDAGLSAEPKDAHCAQVFGDALTPAFGRVDGTVVAVVPPADPGCALPNSDHLVVQVAFDGGVYRMVINVQSSFGDPRIQLKTVHAPLPAPAFAEGWHTSVSLDYPTQFGLHSDLDAGWEPVDLNEATRRISALIEIGARLSTYSTAGAGYADSTHLVHRNGGGHDGAVVVNPTSPSPTWLLFHFANQIF